MNGVALRDDVSSVYCGSFSAGRTTGRGATESGRYSDSCGPLDSQTSRKFGHCTTPEQQKMYDAYLVKLNPKSDYAKTLGRLSQSQQSAELRHASSVAAPAEVPHKPRPRASDDERQRIRERYSDNAKERRVKMYEQALLIAEEREREDGRRFRAQRTIKFHVNYQTYVSTFPLSVCNQLSIRNFF